MARAIQYSSAISRIATQYGILFTALVFIMPAGHAKESLFPDESRFATPMAVELHLPLTQLRKIKADDEETELAGTLQTADGVSLTVRIRPRGKSRRKECDFPPLWLDFKKKQLDGTIWAGQNKLKLVTHCSKKFAKREYLATEMFVYRLLNLFTDNSFRVRALEITYVDTDRERQEKYSGFVIEHKKALATRLRGDLMETSSLKLSQLDAEYASFVSLFAYFIGNTDFSLRQGPGGDCCHNAVPLKVGDLVFTIPYDFDAAGLVDPPYAAPAPNLSIRRVTQRLYRGYCEHNDLLDTAIENFSSRRVDVQTLIDGFNDIPGFRPKSVTAYLDKFYTVIENPTQVRSKILKKCR